ncbi:hypothetical protein TRICI_004108 [Trichomonascus ciferrii]|uniref:Uncharacterized protein n=1 Tax=Trichomonascus ciferrii TaxID=44093 RepID=A0A642V218_9ASCO|nr:hypothetical protein TRICI_004108 [Trichomonascus ciferrii]
MVDKDLVYSFSHARPTDNKRSVPILTTLYKDGIIIGFSDGSIHIYEDFADTGPSLLARIGYYKSAYIKQQLQPLITVLDVYDLKTSDGNCEVLIVGYADGNLCQYLLPSGKLLAHNKLPFRCRGVDTNFNFTLLLVWGYSCEMFLLDKQSLSISVEWKNLPDWPMPIPLFDNQILIIYKSGATSRWRVWSERSHTKLEFLESSDNGTIAELTLFPPAKANGERGHCHDVDLITGVRRVGPISWLVVQRSGWTLYRWEEEQLVKQISSGANQVLVSTITIPKGSENDECFGILSRDGTVVWVCNSNVQLIEPNWIDVNGHVVSVVYDANNKHLVCIFITESGIHVKRADTTQMAVSWERDSMVLEEYQSGPTYVSAVHGDNVVIGHGKDLFEYCLADFLTRFGTISPTFSLESENERFTVIENSSSLISYVVAGTSHGRILAIGKEKGNKISSISAFASPTLQILRIPEDVRPYSGNVVAISRSSTICILDLFSGVKKRMIPGNSIDVRAIMLFYVGEDEVAFEVEYENGERRWWNVDTGEEISEKDASTIPLAEKRKLCSFDDTNLAVGSSSGPNGGILQPLNPGNHSQPIDPFVLVRMDRLTEKLAPCLDSENTLDHDNVELVRAIITSLITIDTNLVTQKWHQQVTTAVEGPKARVGQVNINASFITISSLANPDHGLVVSDSATTACIVTIWVLLVRLLVKSLNIHETTSPAKLLGWLLEITNSTNTNLSGFAVLGATSSSPHIRQYARMCLKELLNSENEQEDESVVGHWKQYLPTMTTGNIFDAESLQAVEILSSMCISRQKRGVSSSLVRGVAESLQLYLTSEAPERHRDSAVEIIGRGWLLWQQQFNPLNVLDALIALLYENGYTMQTLPKDSRRANLLTLCQRCIFNIATQNITLLISALVTHLGSSEQPLDARITSIRIITKLISSTPRHIDPEHLPTIISTVVKTLDPSDPVLRELSPTGGTSLITEATQFLSTAMNRYPNYLAFHKAQQRLAVSTCNPETHKPMALLGLVYDLRTGTVITSLAAEENKAYPQGTVLSNLTFSPNGKAIAAVIKPPELKPILLSWKIGFGFMTIFQSLATNDNDVGSVSPKAIQMSNDQTYEVSTNPLQITKAHR